MNPKTVTPALRVLVVDDEPTARRGLRLLLQKHPDLLVVGEASHVNEAEETVKTLKPDILLLDVQMPEHDGFELVRRLGRDRTPVVIFVTAYDEHALRAFEVNAVDYLLKPYEDARFDEAMDRAREAVRQRQGDSVHLRLTQLLQYLESNAGATAEAGTAGALTDRILIKSSGEIIFLKVRDVDWIEAEGDYMVFHTAGKSHMLRETMARLEARLDPRRFVRIHRSTIVNIDRVRKLTPSFAGEYAVILEDGTKLKLSRGYQERLQSLLKQSL